MGYHKTPTFSSNNYKKNAGVGGFRRFSGSSGLSINTYKQKTSVGAANSTRYGGSSSLSTNGYKGCSSGYGGSKIAGSVGNDKDKKITPISEVDPMLNDITIQGRCISIWHSHRMNAAHDPYSLDLVLQDVHNTRIQVYIKKEFMFRFEPLFEEGQCYILSNFSIAENSGRLLLLPHRYKIRFYKCTTVTRIEPFDTNTNGFILEPFNNLLDPEHHEYYENDVVGVIGSVVGIGDIVPVIGNHLDFTFWDTWAIMWDQYANKRDAIEHLVIILQLGKDSHCIVYARIHRIHKEHGWAYTACKQCNKKVDILPRQNRPPVYVCEEHGTVQPASRFEVIVRVIDDSGSAPLLFFNNNFFKLSRHIAWELIKKYNMDPDEYWPEELDQIVGKKCLFKILYSKYNVTKNNHTYRCDSFSEDVELINHFKKNFIDTDTDDEESSDELAQSTTKKNKGIKEDSSDEQESEMHTASKTKKNKAIIEDNKNIIEESSVNHDSDMHTPTKTRKSTRRVQVSTSKKRKLINDEPDVESDPAHELVAEQMEPED
ncbi:replication protein A 70 kDa DNA-binding subunit B [Tanacetum coccineum]